VKKSAFGTVVPFSKRLLIIGTVALLTTFSAFPENPELQEKLAAVKEVAGENKQMLHQYQWIETTQLTLKGDQKPPTENSCQYGPDGQVQKTPIGPPPEQPSGGRRKERIIEKKKADERLHARRQSRPRHVCAPDPQRMQQAYQAGNVALSPVPGAVNLVFTSYAQQGDKMTLTFDTNAKKITSLNINTYMGQEKDAVTLQVQMGSLPDGTNHAQQTVLNATAKQLVVTTTNSNYQKL
jgi:hypothetical protein